MMEQEKAGKGEDHDSGIGACSADKAPTGAEMGKEMSEKEEEKIKEEEEGDEEEDSGDELLTFPSSGILSPLSKSVEAVVTPLVRLMLEWPLADVLKFISLFFIPLCHIWSTKMAQNIFMTGDRFILAGRELVTQM